MTAPLRGLLFGLLAFASEAQALSSERVQLLYNTLELSLQCEAASGYLKVSLAPQREHLFQIITRAGSELGMAMLTGEVSEPDPGYGRRCLYSFNLAPAPELNSDEAHFLIGFGVGKARACFSDLLAYEMNEAVPRSPLIGGNSVQEVEDRMRSQAFALERFKQLGCEELTGQK